MATRKTTAKGESTRGARQPPHPNRTRACARKTAADLEKDLDALGPTPEPAAPPKDGSRPGISDYTQARGVAVCRLIEEGKTLREIEAEPGMPTWETIRAWLRTNDEFVTAYQAARITSAEALELRMLDVARTATDKDSAASARVMVSTLQWIASKRAPKVYGDKLALDVNAPPAQSLSDEKLHARIEELLAKARRKSAPSKEEKSR